MPFNKQLHLNRTAILGANGIIHLSIPLAGGRNQKAPFKEVQIANDENWRRVHWRSIHDAYRKAPWFEEYAPGIEKLYSEPEKFLLDWNLKTIDFCLKSLHIKCDLVAENVSFNETNNLSQNVNNNLSISSLLYPKYQQVFSNKLGFQQNISIIDLIFCEGPFSLNYFNNIAVI